MPRSKDASPDASEAKPESPWRAVRWEDLEDWAGAKTVERGKKYQTEGRVGDLAVTRDGGLLATVAGTEDYATHVRLEGESDRPRPESSCTCPVGVACKHAVATIVEYLRALAAGRDVPEADEDDPRWHDLDEPYDEAYEDEPRPKRSRLASKAWDERIRARLLATPHAELVEKLLAIANGLPEVYEALREEVALHETGPVDLIAEARRAIKKATSVDPWRNHWDDEGELPDYRPVERVLRRLLELERADDVVALGRVLLEKGFQQLGRANDDGETNDRLHRCLKVVFEAVAKSSMSGPDRLLFAIDADLDEPSDVVDDAADPVFDPEPPPADWSVVADVMLARLKALPASKTRDFETRYQREAVAFWAAEALEKAGRDDELPALLESEARATGDRDRFIALLIGQGRLDDAEREAREALAERVKDEPGTAARLARTLADLAARRERWDVVAAHAAQDFLINPGVSTFKALLEAADKAGVEPAVRAAAFEFLRSGRAPYEWVESKPKPVPRLKTAKKAVPKSKAVKKAAAKPASVEPVESAGLKVDPAWPLPVPDELVAFLKPPSRLGHGPQHPRLDVLIDIALDEDRVETALDYHDAMTAEAGTRASSSYYFAGPDRNADRLAAAAAATHPERALAIYRAELDRSLPVADFHAYDRSARLLALMRPIYKALGRDDEWSALVASAREKYRNRPRFLQQLDETLGRKS